jgi:glycogen debranching enzyme
VIAFPLFAGLVNGSQAAAIARTLAANDMLSPVGLRSTSSADPRYNNDDVIVPYSNWRGPMWVNANAVAAYGLADYGYRDLALEIASRVTRALAADLRNSSKWHEAYATDGSGAALAAPGFLSWDTLTGELLSNLRGGVNPFKL